MWDGGPTIYKHTISSCQKHMPIVLQTSFTYQPWDIIQLKMATFAPIAAASSARRSYAHNGISTNCSTQVLCHEFNTNDTFVNLKTHEISTSSWYTVYFVVCGLLSIKTVEGIWVVCRKLCCIQDDHRYPTVPDGAQFELVRLEHRVRRVAEIRKCRQTCTINERQHNWTWRFHLRRCLLSNWKIMLLPSSYDAENFKFLILAPYFLSWTITCKYKLLFCFVPKSCSRHLVLKFNGTINDLHALLMYPY